MPAFWHGAHTSSPGPPSRSYLARALPITHLIAPIGRLPEKGMAGVLVDDVDHAHVRTLDPKIEGTARSGCAGASTGARRLASSRGLSPGL